MKTKAEQLVTVLLEYDYYDAGDYASRAGGPDDPWRDKAGYGKLKFKAKDFTGSRSGKKTGKKTVADFYSDVVEPDKEDDLPAKKGKSKKIFPPRPGKPSRFDWKPGDAG